MLQYRETKKGENTYWNPVEQNMELLRQEAPKRSQNGTENHQMPRFVMVDCFIEIIILLLSLIVFYGSGLEQSMHIHRNTCENRFRRICAELNQKDRKKNRNAKHNSNENCENIEK